MKEAFSAPKTTAHLEQLRRMVRGEVSPPPVAELIGFRMIAAELGRSVMELQTSARHANPMGTLHGGIVCDLADAAMGTALASTLEDDESFTTLDLTTKFFKPIWNTRLEAVARVTRRTRALGFIECDVTDESGSLVAKVFSSCMVLRGQQAAGR
ncbi:MAG: hypothetical protein JWM53_5048 [bacterium]|nr:hypothetical protein [bacterium]